MKDALQFVEDVAAEARRERLAVDDGVDERRLGLENGLDEVVDRVPRHEIVTLTVRVWPIRYARSSACQWFVGTQSRSLKTTCVAAVRFSPVPPATMFATRTRTSSSFWKRSTSGCRAAAGVFPVTMTAVEPSSRAIL